MKREPTTRQCAECAPHPAREGRCNERVSAGGGSEGVVRGTYQRIGGTATQCACISDDDNGGGDGDDASGGRAMNTYNTYCETAGCAVTITYRAEDWRGAMAHLLAHGWYVRPRPEGAETHCPRHCGDAHPPAQPAELHCYRPAAPPSDCDAMLEAKLRESLAVPGATVAPARYAKRMQLVKPAKNAFGLKGVIGELCEALNGRWTHREGGYVLPPSKVRRLAELVADGVRAELVFEGSRVRYRLPQGATTRHPRPARRSPAAGDATREGSE